MLKTAKRITVLQVVNPGEIIGDLDEKAAKELGLQQWNQTKGTVYRLDSKTLPIYPFIKIDFLHLIPFWLFWSEINGLRCMLLFPNGP